MSMKLIEPLGYVRETGLNNFDFTTWNMLDRSGWEPVYVLSEEQRNWLARLNRKGPSELLCDQTDEIDRNARAYGWEIGRGQIISKKLNTSEGNPFMDPNWREAHGIDGPSERSDSTTR